MRLVTFQSKSGSIHIGALRAGDREIVVLDSVAPSMLALMMVALRHLPPPKKHLLLPHTSWPVAMCACWRRFHAPNKMSCAWV